jgi:hypothetical protein
MLKLSERLISKENKSVESNGYYERVPIRVGEFTLNENSENKLVFETTAQEFCNSGPKIILKITNGDSGWSVQRKQGTSMDMLVPSVDLTTDKLERRRAFWHTAQYMGGKELSHKERFSTIHQGYNNEIDLFRDDAFFKQGTARTTDPFEQFLKSKLIVLFSFSIRYLFYQ